MSDRLAGRVVIVMGAGSVGPGWSNGKACAVRYAREGATLVCADRKLERAQETAGIIASEGGRHWPSTPMRPARLACSP